MTYRDTMPTEFLVKLDAVIDDLAKMGYSVAYNDSLKNGRSLKINTHRGHIYFFSEATAKVAVETCAMALQKYDGIKVVASVDLYDKETFIVRVRVKV